MQHHLKDRFPGQRIRDGMSVTIGGERNVGKSSLLTTLCAADLRPLYLQLLEPHGMRWKSVSTWAATLFCSMIQLESDKQHALDKLIKRMW